MKTIVLILSVLLSASLFSQSKLNDTIGGIIITSHKHHRNNSTLSKRETTMFFINFEDGLVLQFIGFDAVMTAKLEYVKMVDSILVIHYNGFNRKYHKSFHESIEYNLRNNSYVLMEENRVITHKKVKYEFTPDQAWYYIPE
jgi:hypothetical protein